VEKHTDFQFELYKNTALLTFSERKLRYNLFPDNRAICDLALQFAAVARQKQADEQIPLQWDGSIYLTRVDFLNWMQICRERYAAGWSKQYREMNLADAAEELLALLIEWKMAAEDPAAGVIKLHPLLVRTTGSYPGDFDSRSVKGEETLEEK